MAAEGPKALSTLELQEMMFLTEGILWGKKPEPKKGEGSFITLALTAGAIYFALEGKMTRALVAGAAAYTLKNKGYIQTVDNP